MSQADRLIVNDLFPLIKRADPSIDALESLLRDQILRNYGNVDGDDSSQIEFSTSAWFKKQKRTQELLSEIREIRKAIDSVLISLSA
jgi:hypothetical protein